MNELTTVLDELVVDAPIGRANWSDVQVRAQRHDDGILRPRLASSRVAIALAAIAVLAVAGTAVALGLDLVAQQNRFHATAPDHPQRVGPIVEITSGNDWALIAWQSEVGVCLDFAIPGNSPFSCGFPVRGAKPANDATGAGLPTHAVAGTISGGNLVGGDGKATIFGVAAREINAVTVELHDGRVVNTSVYDAPLELDLEVRFFIVRLKLPPQGLRGAGPVRAFNAYADGRLIERAFD